MHNKNRFLKLLGNGVFSLLSENKLSSDWYSGGRSENISLIPKQEHLF